jgi:hypothetical protein
LFDGNTAHVDPGITVADAAGVSVISSPTHASTRDVALIPRTFRVIGSDDRYG